MAEKRTLTAYQHKLLDAMLPIIEEMNDAGLTLQEWIKVFCGICAGCIIDDEKMTLNQKKEAWWMIATEMQEWCEMDLYEGEQGV